MKQTENLQLPILQSGDKYTKETQNEAFKKVDLHLGGLAKRVNNIVASGGENNTEIVDARRDNNTGVVYNTLGERIDTVSEQLYTKANEVDLIVERKRIDSFVSLPEGTTQGNAELIDGRIGANGEEYGSIGENIRSIGSALHCLKPKNLAKQEGRLIDTGFYNDGSLDTNNNGYTVLDYIKVEKGQHIFSSRNGVVCTADSIVTYNSNKEVVAWEQYFEDMVIPNGVSYVRVMISESKLDGYQIELDGITAYEPYFKPYYVKCAKESDVENLKEDVKEIDTFIPYQKGKNLFNVSKIEKDKAFYADGNINTSSGYCISDFIEVESGRTIYGSVNSVAKTVDRYNKYDANKNLLSSVQYFDEYTVEDNVKYIRVQLQTSLSSTFQIEYDGVSSYENYKKPYKIQCAKETDVQLLKNNINILKNNIDTKNIIDVRQDGTGDYTTLNDALNSIKDNSSTNKYLIHLHEGKYNVCSFFTSEQINNAEYTDTGFVGLEVREGIYIEGIGVKEKIIIHGEIPTSYPQNKREQISTLNLKGNCGLKNLTVTSKYLRYAIHDDFSHNENAEHIIENCDFINLVGSNEIEFSNHGYGLGTKSGCVINFEKCNIKPSIIYHTNTSFLKPSVVNMKDCYVDGEIELWDFNSTALDCYLNLYNTRYNNIRHAYNGSEKRQYIKIKGIGNSKSPIICDNSVTYKTDETIEIKNNSSYTIPIGKAVKRTGLKTIEPMSSTDDPRLFYGIAIQTIEGGKSGLIQTNGYINSNFIDLTLNVGDKIGVVNGELSIVTGNEVGKVEFDYNDIKLIKLY